MPSPFRSSTHDHTNAAPANLKTISTQKIRAIVDVVHASWVRRVDRRRHTAASWVRRVHHRLHTAGLHNDGLHNAGLLRSLRRRLRRRIGASAEHGEAEISADLGVRFSELEP